MTLGAKARKPRCGLIRNIVKYIISFKIVFYINQKNKGLNYNDKEGSTKNANFMPPRVEGSCAMGKSSSSYSKNAFFLSTQRHRSDKLRL